MLSPPATHEGSRRLVEMMEEFGIANLDRLGEHIIETSRQATIEAIGKLKKGSYHNSLTMDGFDRPPTLAAEITIGAPFRLRNAETVVSAKITAPA
jgi:N-methylhydantoinase B/oxoprolinase/acetone carboxylase alpha subunit